MDVLARFSLRNRALTALLTVFAMVAGGWATGSLRQELFPSLQLPVIGIVTIVPGANAGTVEERVTKPMEAAVLGIRGVESVESTSRNNVSSVLVRLSFGSDIGQAQTDTQRAVLNVRDLPDDAEPQVFAGSLDDFPIIQFSVAGGDDRYDLLNKVRSIVVPDVEEIDGVRDVQVSGVEAQVVQIDVDAEKLAASRVSPADLADILDANGVRIPAGSINDGDETLNVQVGTPLESVAELRDIPLIPPAEEASDEPAGPGDPAQPTGPPTASAEPEPTRLGDVADVALIDPETTVISRTNGEPALTVAIIKRPDGNTVDISRALAEMIPDLQADIGGGEIDVVYDDAPFIEESVRDLGTEGVLGLTFAVVVVFLFLLSLRLTLVTAVSIPLSLLIALLGLKVGGFTLNIITLGALTITVGRVVDDSIVVVENIQRHLGMGEPKRTAIPTAVKEVAGAITSSTLTTVAVFLPMAIVGDIVGELFRPFALTVTLAMLASLFVALTIVPVLAYWFLRERPRNDARPNRATGGATAARPKASWLQRLYLPSLRWSLRHTWATLTVGALLLGASFYGATLLKTDFIGDSGGNTLSITQQLPAGTSIEATDEAAQELEAELMATDGVDATQVTIGASDFALFFGGGLNTATFAITVDEDADAATIADQVRAFADEHPELGRVTISAAGGPGMNQDAEIVVTAPDADSLRTAAEAITAQVEALETASDVQNTLVELVPTIKVEVDRDAAAELGFSETAVAGQVAAAMRGQSIGEITIDGLGHDVVLRLKDAPMELSELKDLVLLELPTGPIRLTDVASVTETTEAASLARTDGLRSASVTATPATDNLGALTAELQQIIDSTELPTGARAEIGGVSAQQADSFSQLWLAIAIAIAITYAILVATFRSLLQPLILMVSVPFAATGAFALLLATDTPLGLAAIIGLLMLVGIVVTNAIVLIDLVNQYRDRGLSVSAAVIEGCRDRLRPIVMTALATVLALTPMAFAITGGGAFISQPLAIVTIGGLVSSTLLTLILVPVLYSLVERFRERHARA